MSFKPHPIPYQGSKRLLAPSILRCFPPEFDRMLEPFAGSAAMTLSAASSSRASKYLIADILQPLVDIWDMILTAPADLADAYELLWQAQHTNPKEHFLQVRSDFNRTQDPIALLYLLARCVKNAVRFNTDGEFNQSADHRRKGMHPEKMRKHIEGAAQLLSGRTSTRCASYGDVLDMVTQKDFVYMDPPYQGVSKRGDARYHSQVQFDELMAELEKLNARDILYLLSYDGRCGGKSYGYALPRELNLTKIEIHVGRSTQATLAGRIADTVESLYISPKLSKILQIKDSHVSVRNTSNQLFLVQ